MKATRISTRRRRVQRGGNIREEDLEMGKIFYMEFDGMILKYKIIGLDPGRISVTSIRSNGRWADWTQFFYMDQLLNNPKADFQYKIVKTAYPDAVPVGFTPPVEGGRRHKTRRNRK